MTEIIIRWDKTQQTWHTDVDKVGRYSVRRPGPRLPYRAYLNNHLLGNIRADKSVDYVKHQVEGRIREARYIAERKD